MKKVTDQERREQVSFDAFYFQKEKGKGNSYAMKEAFNHISQVNLWGAEESLSGEGSTDRETENLISEIEKILKTYTIQSILDAPCGDFGWLSKVPSLKDLNYIGMDILEQFAEHHKKTYEDKSNFEFLCGDLTKDPLPCVDLILCRDCLVHFSYTDIQKALQNFKRSGSPYLLITTFTECTENTDILTGDWRLLNFENSPFNFPTPEKIIIEGCAQNNGLYKDKSLGLWDLNKIDI